MRPRILSAVAILAIAAGALAGAARGQDAQRPSRPALPDARDGLVAFELTLKVVPTALGDELRSEEPERRVYGCRTERPCAWKLDETGLIEGDDPRRPQGRVRLTVEARKDGVNVKCARGCMWIARWFPCDRKQACAFTLNEFGIRGR